MNKQTKTHAVAIAIMASVGLAAPLASWYANAPQERPAAAQEAPAEAPAVLPEPVVAPAPREVTLDPVTVVGRAPRAASPAPVAKAQRCHDHVLEQGGSPEHPTVRVCVPAG
jgi:hypothetical protein